LKRKDSARNRRLSLGFTAHLIEDVAFEVGGDQFSRQDMIDDLGCANFIAASNLSRLLFRLKVVSALQLFELGPLSLARVRGIGESAMWVATCYLDSKGYNVELWWGWNDQSVKFSTMKHRKIVKARRAQHVA